MGNIWRQIFRPPLLPIRFCHESTQLARHIRQLREGGELAAPGIKLSLANRGFGQVVKHEGDRRAFAHQRGDRWQLVVSDADVERKTEGFEQANSSDEVCAASRTRDRVRLAGCASLPSPTDQAPPVPLDMDEP